MPDDIMLNEEEESALERAWARLYAEKPETELSHNNYEKEKISNLEKVYSEFTEEQLEGIRCYYNQSSNIAVIDIMDWGDGKIGKELGDKFSKIVGDNHIIYHNEGPALKGDGWIQIGSK